MYTQDTIAVNEGDKITGVFSCKANARNPRDLDLAIDYEVNGQHPSKDSLQYKM
jgi:protein arginine N-methyltransferase 1